MNCLSFLLKHFFLLLWTRSCWCSIPPRTTPQLGSRPENRPTIRLFFSHSLDSLTISFCRYSVKDNTRCNCDIDVITLSDMERILLDGRRIATALSSAPVERIPTKESHGLEAALQEVATPIPIVEYEDMFDGRTDSHVSEEHADSSI